jgi:hypothetical protein
MMAADGPDAHGPDDRARRIRARNWALLAVLVGLVALFYALTIVRMGGGH